MVATYPEEIPCIRQQSTPIKQKNALWFCSSDQAQKIRTHTRHHPTWLERANVMKAGAGKRWNAGGASTSPDSVAFEEHIRFFLVSPLKERMVE